MQRKALQDYYPGNHCWGCGIANDGGLQIKSYIEGDEVVCRWTPHPEHATWLRDYTNGGIIATIMDCHSIWTAIARAYEAEGRALDSQPNITYVTASLTLSYLRPTPLAGELTLRSRVTQLEGKKGLVVCTLYAGGEECVKSELLGIRVADGWGRDKGQL